jgi:hypothetical protein
MPPDRNLGQLNRAVADPLQRFAGRGRLFRVQSLLRYLPQVSIEVRLTADGIGIVATSVGVLSGQDLLHVAMRLREELERDPGIRYAVMDHSAIPEEKIDIESVRQLAAQALEPAPELTVAIVAPNEILFGLSRMWEMLAERPGLVTKVVRNRAEAIKWLQDELAQPVLPF